MTFYVLVLLCHSNWWDKKSLVQHNFPKQPAELETGRWESTGDAPVCVSGAGAYHFIMNGGERGRDNSSIRGAWPLWFLPDLAPVVHWSGDSRYPRRAHEYAQFTDGCCPSLDMQPDKGHFAHARMRVGVCTWATHVHTRACVHMFFAASAWRGLQRRPHATTLTRE